jgi:GDPmannose 4,6-dehydratase
VIQKKVIISGINGQDGAYLADKLISKGLKVFGILRRGSTQSIERLEYKKIQKRIEFIRCDLSEFQTITNYIKDIKPHYFYNLGAQSFVQYSFENPFYTFKINSEAVLNILETLRREKNINCKFYQASTSEMFGNTNFNKKGLIDFNSKFNPQSPYAVSKLSAHQLVKTYRESYNLFACSGILFNHESPIRGREFVTKKIIENLVNQKLNDGDILKLGNLNSKRDWGHADDYVNAMIKMMSMPKADDYIISTSKAYSIREFFLIVAKKLGFSPKFFGKGKNEFCIDKNSNKKIMIIDEKYYRDNELHTLRGDSFKSAKKLKWKRNYNLNSMIDEMIDFEIDKINI